MRALRNVVIVSILLTALGLGTTSFARFNLVHRQTERGHIGLGPSQREHGRTGLAPRQLGHAERRALDNSRSVRLRPRTAAPPATVALPAQDLAVSSEEGGTRDPGGEGLDAQVIAKVPTPPRDPVQAAGPAGSTPTESEPEPERLPAPPAPAPEPTPALPAPALPPKSAAPTPPPQPPASTAGPVDVPVPPSSCDFLFEDASQAPACWRPYSDRSPFNMPLTEVAPHPASTAIVDRLTSFWEDSASFAPRLVVGNADTPDDYHHPVYFADGDDPAYTVRCSYSDAWGPCEVEGLGLRIPAGARPAGGSDGHMAVIDQQGGWEYDFWQAEKPPAGGGTLNVGYGGQTEVGPGSDGLGSAATAAHFGVAAGIIRPQELAAGVIDHALFMVVKCTNGTSVWPAGPDTGRSCSSMGLSNANAPAMGQHFYLDMSDAQINALPQPAWAKTILRAMARYGLYVGDTGGGFLKIESGSSYTSFGQAEPWQQIGADAGWRSLTSGEYELDLSEAVEWGTVLRAAAP